MTAAVICSFARTPFARAGKGALARTRPDDLAAAAVRAALERAGIKAEEVEDVIMGCAFPEAEQGLNIARIAAALAGLPDHTAGVTVNRFCGSSMQALHMAAGAIANGAGRAFVCAGVESMTRVPMPGFNPLPHPQLARERPEVYMSMGLTAERLAVKYKIPRKEQELYALSAHRRAAAARDDGLLGEEIVPLPAKSGDFSVDAEDFNVDECIRADTSEETLASLEPAFDAEGTVTAGTSAPLTDGAAALVVCSEGWARDSGLPVLARVKAMAVSGCAPEIMGIGPVEASRKALARAGLSLDDMDVIEINEAFAVQVLAVCRELGLAPERINRDGGALALGHPLGASGARLCGHAALALRRVKGRLALATMCIGGGQGIATVLEAP